jgi:hypothetical protein
MDLHAMLTFNGKGKTHSLDFYCKRFKLDVPDDPYTGKDIGRLVKEQKWAEVMSHCQCDVLKTAALGRRCGWIAPPIQQEAF